MEYSNKLCEFNACKRGGHIVSALASGSNGLDSGSGKGHCAVSSLTVPVSTRVFKFINCARVTCVVTS